MSNTYRYRDAMLNNLIANKRLTGTKNFLKMFGEPTRINTDYIFCRIIQTKLGEMLTYPEYKNIAD